MLDRKSIENRRESGCWGREGEGAVCVGLLCQLQPLPLPFFRTSVTSPRPYHPHDADYPLESRLVGVDTTPAAPSSFFPRARFLFHFYLSLFSISPTLRERVHGTQPSPRCSPTRSWKERNKWSSNTWRITQRRVNEEIRDVVGNQGWGEWDVINSEYRRSRRVDEKIIFFWRKKLGAISRFEDRSIFTWLFIIRLKDSPKFSFYFPVFSSTDR